MSEFCLVNQLFNIYTCTCLKKKLKEIENGVHVNVVNYPAICHAMNDGQD